MSNIYIYIYILSGWWYTNPSEKNMKVNGKDDIPYIMENQNHVWNHQPVIYIYKYIPTLASFL